MPPTPEFVGKRLGRSPFARGSRAGVGLCLLMLLATSGGRRVLGQPLSELKLPQVPAGAVEVIETYIKSGDAERNQIVAQHAFELSDVVHVLLDMAGRSKLGLPVPTLSVPVADVLRDLATRGEKSLKLDTFRDDIEQILALDEGQAGMRIRVMASVHRDLAGLQEAVSKATDLNDLSASATEVLQRLESLGKSLANDRVLARYVAVARVTAIGLFRGQDPPFLRTERVRALEAVAEIFSRHGLEGDQHQIRAEIEVASLCLRRGLLAEAQAAIAAARRGALRFQMPAWLGAQLRSLELEIHQARGFVAATFECAKELEELIQQIPTERLTAPIQRQIVIDWHLQTSAIRTYNGQHSEALALLERAQEIPGARLGQRLRLTYQRARNAEIRGDLMGAREGVEALLRELQDFEADAPESLLKNALELGTRALSARLETALGNLPGARLAIHECQRLLKLRDGAITPPLRAEANLSIALVAASDDDIEGALAATGNALAALPEGSAATERVQALDFRTRLFLAMGEIEEASKSAQLALTAAQAAIVDRERLIASANLSKAQVLLTHQRFGEAAESAKETLVSQRPLLASLPGLRGLAERICLESDWRLAQNHGASPKNLEVAIERAERCLRDLRGTSGRGADSLLEILKICELIQDVEVATRRDPTGQRALALAKAAWNEFVPASPTSEASKPGNEAVATLAILEGRCHEAEGKIEEAVAAYRRAAAREDRLRERLRFRAPDGLSARFETLQDRIAGLLLLAAENDCDPAKAREALVDLEATRARTFRTLILAARHRSLSISSESGEGAGPRLKPPPEFSSQRLDEVLIPKRAVLVYAFTSRGNYVLGLSRGKTLIARIPESREAIERSVTGFLQAMRGEAAPDRARSLVTHGRALHRALIAPVAAVLDGAHEIVVVPDGPMHGVPFAALPESDFVVPFGNSRLAKAPWLLARPSLQSITCVPSLAALALLTDFPPKTPRQEILIVGAPEIRDGALPELRAAEREIDLIASRFPAERTLVLRGRGATRASLESALPGEFGILHFATHASRLLDPGSQASLVLSPEVESERFGTLTPADAANLKLNQTRLVVLGACSSALARQAGPEGSLGLPRAFLLAGATNVIATATEISDTATVELMKTLYALLLSADRPRPSSALLAAQRRLAQSETHCWPGVWAPFFTYGVP